ncbi:MAG TPA: tryptophan--tRNA ligase [Actinomycetota bacterium]|nr:tryptophan--tRNA ligase [Actinomycetota bacterium]
MPRSLLTFASKEAVVARVFSGIKPSGDLQLGNYIGALQYFVADQDVHDCFFCVVDLHAITVPQDPQELQARTLQIAALYMAVGLDPAKATLFVQSHVSEHAELAWVLGCYAMFGEMRRMTQFKDKAAKQQDGAVSLGLFAYPALMAADILLYDTDRVPVGDDQKQHLELTRDVAIRFNNRYGETFVVPEPAIPKQGARIMDLQEPSNKMSKSEDSPQGTILLLDPPDVVRKKIKTAVTDSGREVLARADKPAISNLLTIFSAVTGTSVSDLEQTYEGKGYGDFKRELGDALVAFLEPIQARYASFVNDRSELARVLESGAQKAESVAAKTLARAYERVGFLPRG